MTQQHPITPPPELVQQWVAQHADYEKGFDQLLIEATQWGADQELEACCERILNIRDADALRAARRPKLPSLKEQALKAVKQIPVEPDGGPWRTAMETIIRALHQLPDQN